MDNQRLLIWAFFALMAWMTYQAWMEDYGPQPAESPPPPAVIRIPTANGHCESRSDEAIFQPRCSKNKIASTLRVSQ